MLQWVSTCCDYLYRDLVLALLKSDDPTAEDLYRVRRDLEIVDRQLSGNAFLLGSEIYLCDLFLLPMLGYSESRASTLLLQGLGGLSAWYERLAARTSFEATAA